MKRPARGAPWSIASNREASEWLGHLLGCEAPGLFGMGDLLQAKVTPGSKFTPRPHKNARRARSGFHDRRGECCVTNLVQLTGGRPPASGWIALANLALANLALANLQLRCLPDHHSYSFLKHSLPIGVT
jgi:hypothetical protein